MNDADRGLLLQRFVELLPDYGLVVLGPDGNILSWNAGAQAILGYAPYEIVGHHFSCLYLEADIKTSKPAKCLRDALARGRQEDTGWRVGKDGACLNVHSVFTPLFDEVKTLVGFGLQVRNVTSAISATSGPDLKLVATAPVGEREKILVVDDDQMVRTVTVRQLTGLGYRAIAASSGAEALDMLAREDVDLMLTDVIMPGGMSGGEMAAAARQLRPTLKVLFASGYFEGALVRDKSLQAGEQLLVKPYRTKELARKVEEMLATLPST